MCYNYYFIYVFLSLRVYYIFYCTYCQRKFYKFIDNYNKLKYVLIKNAKMRKSNFSVFVLVFQILIYVMKRGKGRFDLTGY